MTDTNYDELKPACPNCSAKATHATVMFDVGNAQCDPCKITWNYWWDNKQPVTGSTKPF